MLHAPAARRFLPCLAAAALGLAASAAAQIVFQPPTATPLAHMTNGVISADLDLDGHADLITLPRFEGAFQSPKFSVLLGNGDGNFAAPITKFVNGQDAGRGAVAFLNADAFPDFVLPVNGGGGTLSFYLGAGDGTFANPQTVGVNGSTHLNDVVPVDLTGDGKLDFVVLDDGVSIFIPGKLHTLVANAGAGYTQLASPSLGLGAMHFALGDVNSDTVLDAVAANFFSGTLSIAPGLAGGGFAAPATLNVGGNPAGLSLHDLDGDGQLDVAYADSLLNRVVTMLGDGRGSFSTLQTLALPGGPNDLAAAQLDFDGELDLLVSRPTAGDVAVLRGAGDGTFSFVTGVSHVANAGGAAFADLNEDGTLDAAVGQASTPGNVAILRNATYQPGSPFTDLGHSKPGTNGYPILLADGTLQVGDPVVFALTNGKPLGNASLVLGFSQVNVPFKGGVMIPAVDVLITPFPMDGTGTVALVSLWPPGVPSGFTFYVQFWFKDVGAPQNEAGSSGLRTVTP